MIKKKAWTLFLGVVLILGLTAAGPASSREGKPVSRANERRFGTLLTDLAQACDQSGTQARQAVERDLTAIEKVNRKDGELARLIADNWQAVYLDPEFELYVHAGDETAPELAGAGIPEGKGHAIVVLGYALRNGRMQPELEGRCDAAAAMARSYPEAIIVCSGGATGENNPGDRTEAGLMKAYLTERCGIDPERIHIDEKARNTAENAVNTFMILQKEGVESMTIVTSTYHQRRGQTLYSLIAELYRRQYGYSARIVGNYCFDAPSPTSGGDHWVAVRQMAQILSLPENVIRSIPRGQTAAPQR